jgi:hypothetical protein
MTCHQYAYDWKGAAVDATKLKYRPGVCYYCNCPQQQHKLKLVKPSGHRRRFTDYFAHVATKKRKASASCCHSIFPTIVDFFPAKKRENAL